MIDLHTEYLCCKWAEICAEFKDRDGLVEGIR